MFDVDWDLKFDCDTCYVDFDCVFHCNWVCDFVLDFDSISHLIEIVICCSISMVFLFSISIVIAFLDITLDFEHDGDFNSGFGLHVVDLDFGFRCL